MQLQQKITSREMSVALNTLAARGGLTEKLALVAAEWKARAAKRRLYRRTYRELSELSAREKADLGLNQSSIGAVAYEAAYGAK